MTITADWQFDIRSLTFGAGVNAIDVTGATGLGDGVDVRSNDQPRFGRPGSTPSRDDATVRPIDIEFDVLASTAALCAAALDDMVEAFRPAATGSEEVTLDARYPGAAETTLRFYGRPRGVRAGPLLPVQFGYMTGGVARFDALDPLRYGAAVASTTNSGNATSDRCTITVTGTGGTPSLVNTSDSSGSILWNTTLAGAATRIIDLRLKSVVDGSGVDKRSEILNTSVWFRFVSGANTVNATGCTAAYSLRPAWF